jgi:adenosine deaminase
MQACFHQRKGLLPLCFAVLCLLASSLVSASDVADLHRAKMKHFIDDMPKVELHIHLEGTMTPDTVSKLARRNKFDYFETVADVESSLANRKPGLSGFLQHHEKQLTVLQTEEDFYTVTYDFLKNCKDNNIVYVEFFFDPQIHTTRGVPFDVVLRGILAGRDAGQKDFGVEANLIMSINREKSVDSAFKMLADAEPYRDNILGLGLDNGPEEGNPPAKFEAVYALAKKQGYYLTAHNDVDEKDTVQHIWESIEILKLDRLDHSLNAMEDLKLVDEINRRGLCLTGSPVQRASDPEPQEVERIRFLFQHGVCVSLHSDDPGEFASGYLSELLFNFQQAGNFTKRDMALMMLNAYEAAWLPEQEKKAYIDRFKTWADANGVRIGSHYFNKHYSNLTKG